jgi:transcriptional regulator with XRE-family HTH domain
MMEKTHGTSPMEAGLLEALGRRLARRRIDQGLTQAELARQAGIGRATVERMERGASTQMSSFIRVLRVLELGDALLDILPEPGPSPMELLRHKGRERQRASSRGRRSASGAWQWQDPGSQDTDNESGDST